MAYCYELPLSQLQSLPLKCKEELAWLDMKVNTKKSGCLRIGLGCSSICANFGHI